MPWTFGPIRSTGTSPRPSDRLRLEHAQRLWVLGSALVAYRIIDPEAQSQPSKNRRIALRRKVSEDLDHRIRQNLGQSLCMVCGEEYV